MRSTAKSRDKHLKMRRPQKLSMQLMLSDKQFLMNFLRVCVVILWISACNVGLWRREGPYAVHPFSTNVILYSSAVVFCMVAVLHRSKTVQMHQYLSDLDL